MHQRVTSRARGRTSSIDGARVSLAHAVARRRWMVRARPARSRMWARGVDRRRGASISATRRRSMARTSQASGTWSRVVDGRCARAMDRSRVADRWRESGLAHGRGSPMEGAHAPWLDRASPIDGARESGLPHTVRLIARRRASCLDRVLEERVVRTRVPPPRAGRGARERVYAQRAMRAVEVRVSERARVASSRARARGARAESGRRRRTRTRQLDPLSIYL